MLLLVIPAKPGIHGKFEAWIPAFAGMTTRYEMVLARTLILARVTKKRGMPQTPNPRLAWAQRVYPVN